MLGLKCHCKLSEMKMDKLPFFDAEVTTQRNMRGVKRQLSIQDPPWEPLSSSSSDFSLPARMGASALTALEKVIFQCYLPGRK